MDQADAYDYELPGTSVAQQAIEPRDSARMLVVRELADRTVADLPQLLDPGDVLVVNRTRVRASRLRGTKRGTGGAVEFLLLRALDDDYHWEALCRPARRLRRGTTVDAGPLSAEILTDPVDGVVSLRFDRGAGSIEDILPTIGEVPLPPYFHGTLTSPDRYQTMFSKTIGSAAAPTAGLHFTPQLVGALKSRGITIVAIDLEVGLDTFRPMGAGTVSAHRMHSEQFDVPAEVVEAVNTARANGRRAVAVGTTVVRSLESAAESGVLEPARGKTALFIKPGYRFRAVDAVLTNFHAPRTTLTVLAAAMIGSTWKDVYRVAIDRGYRFLSFGDAMFIEAVPR